MSEQDKGDDLLDDFDAALAVGRKVIEMAERVVPVDKAAPGAVAAWGFTLEDVTFDVTVKVRR